MLGLQLTMAQAWRLWKTEMGVGRQLLDALLDCGFLCRRGSLYARGRIHGSFELMICRRTGGHACIAGQRRGSALRSPIHLIAMSSPSAGDFDTARRVAPHDGEQLLARIAGNLDKLSLTYVIRPVTSVVATIVAWSSARFTSASC